MSIIKPGRLVVCAVCHKHAHIRLSKQTTKGLIRGPEFAFKIYGFEILNSAVEVFGLSLLESGNIRDQIRESSLSDNHLTVSPRLMWAVHKWNRFLANRDGEPPGLSFHQFMRRVRHSRIPADFVETYDNYYNVGIHPQNPIHRKLN